MGLHYRYVRRTLTLLGLASQIVAISQKAKLILSETFHINEDKLQVIDHGVPDIPLQPPCFYRKKIGIAADFLLFSFGLLSLSKGIEYMIDALPEIIKSYPKIKYLVLGKGHPHYEKSSGKDYAAELSNRAKALDLGEHFIILDKFVAQEELKLYLGAADIYITPYVSQEQISSGTLAFAKASNNVLVSTPYWYAQELIHSGNGLLVDFKSSKSLSDAILSLVSSPKRVSEIARYNYAQMREMIWPKIGYRYAELMTQIRTFQPFLQNTGGHLAEQILHSSKDDFCLSLEHLSVLTDERGIFQHAHLNKPNPVHGYCVDDNARALIVSVWASLLLPEDKNIPGLISTYLNFLHSAFNIEKGAFHNFMSSDHNWLDKVGSEDCQGRAIWALGVTCFYSQDKEISFMANELLKRMRPYVGELDAPRALASAILGMTLYEKSLPSPLIKKEIKDLLFKLSERFNGIEDKSWYWFEDQLTYDNARIPQALLVGGACVADNGHQKLGLDILSFLLETQFDPISGVFVAVGNHGWYQKSGYHSCYDQQPIEACAMVSACLAAEQLSSNKSVWSDYARRAVSWFLGENLQQQVICDLKTGACGDGYQTSINFTGWRQLSLPVFGLRNLH